MRSEGPRVLANGTEVSRPATVSVGMRAVLAVRAVKGAGVLATVGQLVRVQ